MAALPCSTCSSGRFGNQAEQFLGALGFTQKLNRTLVLPHWVEYPARNFQVEPLRAYLKVILMKDFVDRLAEKVWPKGKRYGRRRIIRRACEERFGLF
jgi:peptide-O-fucosyltransferase